MNICTNCQERKRRFTLWRPEKAGALSGTEIAFAEAVHNLRALCVMLKIPDFHLFKKQFEASDRQL